MVLTGGAIVVGLQATNLFPSVVSLRDGIEWNLPLNPMYTLEAWRYIVIVLGLILLATITNFGSRPELPKR